MIAHPTRRAFTLVEVMIALVVAGVVAVTASAMLAGIVDASDRIHRGVLAADRKANGNRMLRALVAQIEPDSVFGGISGNADSAHFATWCDTRMGWQERCKVQLVVWPQVPRNAIVAVLNGTDTVTIADGFENGGFVYLASSAGGGIWAKAWPAGLTPPIALGVIVGGDTTIIRIGERR